MIRDPSRWLWRHCNGFELQSCLTLFYCMSDLFIWIIIPAITVGLLRNVCHQLERYATLSTINAVISICVSTNVRFWLRLTQNTLIMGSFHISWSSSKKTNICFSVRFISMSTHQQKPNSSPPKLQKPSNRRRLDTHTSVIFAMWAIYNAHYNYNVTGSVTGSHRQQSTHLIRIIMEPRQSNLYNFSQICHSNSFEDS